MTQAEARIMVEAKLRCMELEDLACIGKGCDKDCDGCNYNYMQGTVGEQKEALRMAINALEKQVPMKPNGIHCGSCKYVLIMSHDLYCPRCGQRVDWR